MGSSPKTADTEEVAAFEKNADERKGVAPNNWFARQNTGVGKPDVSQEELQTLEQQQEQTQGKKP